MIIDKEYLSHIKSSRRSTIEIPALSAFPELLHGFTTRFGGVSEGSFATFNLNFNRPDPKSNVLENYRLLSHILGVPQTDMVLSYQVHSGRVLPVTREHAGMGLTRERSYKDVDGLTTCEKGLMLVTHYADCVPLYFYDPVKKAIALSHSGWKGTLLDIAKETVKTLEHNYGSQPEDLNVAIGPHIRDCCFEVDRDVAQQFRDQFPWTTGNSIERPGGKWVLNLEGIITESLTQAGVRREHIKGCGVCTRCNSDIFFSHRGSGGNTGTGVAFLMIRGEI